MNISANGLGHSYLPTQTAVNAASTNNDSPNGEQNSFGIEQATKGYVETGKDTVKQVAEFQYNKKLASAYYNTQKSVYDNIMEIPEDENEQVTPTANTIELQDYYRQLLEAKYKQVMRENVREEVGNRPSIQPVGEEVFIQPMPDEGKSIDYMV